MALLSAGISSNKLRLEVLNYGARWAQLEFKRSNGNWIPLITGLPTHHDHLNDNYSTGALLGRVAGRISGGGFRLNGKFHSLTQNNGIHLHGGEQGFGKRYWSFVKQRATNELILSYTSASGEEGYPGQLDVQVSYLLEENSLILNYTAISDTDTLVNLSHHAYFDLGGSRSEYEMKLAAHSYLQTDEHLIPTGKLIDLDGDMLDFRSKKPLGDLELDHCFILSKDSGSSIELYSPATSMGMAVFTDQPAAVVFTPDWDESICFETQFPPDAPNHHHFPSIALRAGEKYRQHTVFKFFEF